MDDVRFPALSEIDDDYTPAEVEYVHLLHGLNVDGTDADPMIVDTVRRSVGYPTDIAAGPQSAEQMCRNLLAYAIREGLVTAVDHEDFGDDPQQYPHGEPCGMANVLSSYLRDAMKK